MNDYNRLYESSDQIQINFYLGSKNLNSDMNELGDILAGDQKTKKEGDDFKEMRINRVCCF